jgi:catechol 2,3-dioxygenase
MSALPAATRMGAVHLSVADLSRSLAFYDFALGLQVHSRSEDRAVLGTGGEDLLVLTERAGAAPADGYAGLFHFALLLPERVDLARWLARAAQEQVPLTGLSDHFVSEAIYLRDPDHHGIEVYWDRPRALWEGQVAERITTEALDVKDLLRGVDHTAGLPSGTVMGHVHLRVASVPETNAFYQGLLGFDVMASMGRAATFLSAGGYHHHVGGNTWESRGAAPAGSGFATLRHATIVVPDEAERDRVASRVADSGQEPETREAGILVRDPSQNALLLTA